MMPNHFEEVRRRALAVRALSRRPPAPTGCPIDGALAYRRRYTLADNPHPRTEPEYQRWRSDWMAARTEDEG